MPVAKPVRPVPLRHPDHPHLTLTEVTIETGRGRADSVRARYTLDPGASLEQLAEIRRRVEALTRRLQRTTPMRHNAAEAILPQEDRSDGKRS